MFDILLNVDIDNIINDYDTYQNIYNEIMYIYKCVKLLFIKKIFNLINNDSLLKIKIYKFFYNNFYNKNFNEFKEYVNFEINNVESYDIVKDKLKILYNKLYYSDFYIKYYHIYSYYMELIKYLQDDMNIYYDLNIENLNIDESYYKTHINNFNFDLKITLPKNFEDIKYILDNYILDNKIETLKKYISIFIDKNLSFQHDIKDDRFFEYVKQNLNIFVLKNIKVNKLHFYNNNFIYNVVQNNFTKDHKHFNEPLIDTLNRVLYNICYYIPYNHWPKNYVPSSWLSEKHNTFNIAIYTNDHKLACEKTSCHKFKHKNKPNTVLAHCIRCNNNDCEIHISASNHLDFDIQDYFLILMHECLHGFGIPHIPNKESIMYPYYNGDLFKNKIKSSLWLDLDDDVVKILHQTYGKRTL